MATSFEELNKEELLAVAAMFAVDAKQNMTKPTIIKELTEMGVDYETYQALLAKDSEVGLPIELAALDDTPLVEKTTVVTTTATTAPVEPEEDFLVVKMVRDNVRFDICGYRFTRDHPYALVKAEDADIIFEQEEGFRTATPKELREFYGQ